MSNSKIRQKMTRCKNDDYECIRCGYETFHKSRMRLHLLNKKKPCPASANDIELTDEVINYILNNRIYRIPEHTTTNKCLDSLKDRNRILEAQVLFLSNKKNEAFFQHILEIIHNGASHKSLKCGITDITNDEMHAEIKEWNHWKEALGQLIAYNTEDPKQIKRVYFFGKYPKNMKSKAVEIMNASGIEVYECEVIEREVRVRKYDCNEVTFRYEI